MAKTEDETAESSGFEPSRGGGAGATSGFEPATQTKVPEPVTQVQAGISGSRRTAPRSTRVVIKKISPWSVLKFSLLFNFCVMLILLGALIIVYQIMSALGVQESIQKLATDVGLGGDAGFKVNGEWLLRRAFVAGLALTVVWSVINVFAAFLYNLVSDVLGGIQVTLSEKR